MSHPISDYVKNGRGACDLPGQDRLGSLSLEFGRFPPEVFVWRGRERGHLARIALTEQTGAGRPRSREDAGGTPTLP
jgi:hypothetical protein